MRDKKWESRHQQRGNWRATGNYANAFLPQGTPQALNDDGKDGKVARRLHIWRLAMRDER